MESMQSMSEIFFNQVEQIADVKTCNIDNVEQKYYKVQWKCTWEPATVLERFCGKIVADFNKHPEHQSEIVKTMRPVVTENNVSIIEKSVINIEKSETESFKDTSQLSSQFNNLNESQLQSENTEIDKEDSQFTSNLFNKEPSKICVTNKDVLNKRLPLNNYSKANNLTQHKFESVNNLTFNNFTIKPDPDQEVFPNINILCETNVTTFNHEEESNATKKDQNKGSLSTLDTAELITRPCNKLSSKISKNTTTNSHKRSNRTNKCFKCQLCSFSSPHNSNLKRHMRKHTGEKPFKCQLCSFSTSQKSNIKIHMLIHTGEKPFKCSLCSFSTSRKSSMKTHMLRHTGADYLFKCHLCSYTTIKSITLIRHLHANHTDQALI